VCSNDADSELWKTAEELGERLAQAGFHVVRTFVCLFFASLALYCCVLLPVLCFALCTTQTSCFLFAVRWMQATGGYFGTMEAVSAGAAKVKDAVIEGMCFQFLQTTK